MKNLFCIVSAIGNDYGVFSYKDRLEQLFDSIKSIRLFSPDDAILIIDASYQPLPDEDLKSLRNLSNEVIELYNTPIVKWLGAPTELSDRAHALERKTLGEVVLVKALLKYLEISSKKYNRVFKLTGRFKLNEDFTKVNYNEAQGKIVILKKEKWSNEAYPLRLWSFDYNQLDVINVLYQRIFESTLVNGSVVELVEKSMYKWTNALKIPTIELEGPIGIEGQMGADGIQLYE
jgi:hypothetical protein